jgi:hypothetical protein
MYVKISSMNFPQHGEVFYFSGQALHGERSDRLDLTVKYSQLNFYFIAKKLRLKIYSIN